MDSIDGEIFRITKAKIRVLEPVKLQIPFQDSTMGPFHSFGLSVLTLEDEDGIQGESPIYNSYAHILEKCLFPILFYNGNISYPQLYTKLYWSIRNEGFRGQASALLGQLDLALYDLAAKRAGKPLHKYLHANRNFVNIYGSGGGTNYTLDQLEKEISFFLSKGIKCIKLKVGKDFGMKMEEDIERVKFVRTIVGKDIKIALDANQIWNYDQTMKFVQRVEHLNIEWLEEPVHSASFSEIEKVCLKSPVKISYGESERSSKMFPSLVKAGVSHLQPVPTQLGSVKEWMDVCDLAKENHVDFTSGGYSLYVASLMASAPEQYQVEYLYSIMHGLEAYFSVCPTLSNGRFELPEIDGLPVRVDWDYCYKKNKIILENDWTKNKVQKYTPEVTM